MDISTSRPSSSNTQVDRYPLLLERMDRPNDHEHIIDITSNNSTSSSSSTDDSQEDGPPSSTWETTYRASSSTAVRGPNPRTATYTRRRDGYSHRRRSPLNSTLWISVELLVTVGQIVASIVVLSLSRDEHPEAPLFAWVVGYACGCVATLPILYWRFRNRNQNVQQDSVQPHQGPSQSNITERLPYTSISISQSSNEENVHSTESDTRSQVQQPLNARLNGLMEHFKMALDCYFAVWFVVGNVWIFGGHSTPADAPKLYRLCIVFLTFSCIGYAMPFILCATICCCLPCIISILGFREDFSHTRGASEDFINTLPTFKFKLNNSGDDNDCSIANQDGVLAAGTEKERVISGEDAACCICLNKYVDDDDIRELPCSHVFHVECIDKWLKINALCPLCKCDVFENNSNTSPSAVESSQQYLQECG